MKRTLVVASLIIASSTLVSNAAEITNAITKIHLDGTLVWTNVIPGHGYTVERTSDLSGLWTNIVENIIPTNVTASTVVAMTNENATFYRVVDKGVYDSGGSLYLGTISGDTGADTVADSHFGFQRDRVTVTEDNGDIFPVYLSCAVSLQSPPGMDYDLYVYDSGYLLIGESATNGIGQLESVKVKWDDNLGSDDTSNIYIEIRRSSGVNFDKWTLDVEGNVSVP